MTIATMWLYRLTQLWYTVVTKACLLPENGGGLQPCWLLATLAGKRLAGVSINAAAMLVKALLVKLCPALSQKTKSKSRYWDLEWEAFRESWGGEDAVVVSYGRKIRTGRSE